MKALWIPIFSMRSYDTGKYALLKDGNFQLTLSRIIASDFDSITIVVPFECSDFQDFMKQYIDVMEMKERNIKVTMMHYGENAVHTRNSFWEKNADTLNSSWMDQFDIIVTDITGYKGNKPFINNFNVTKLPELDRPYIDTFFDVDLDSIERSLFTTVINPRQRDYIIEQAPHLADKVIAYTKVAHMRLLPSDHKTRPLDASMLRTIFWPFRISDKAYKFDAFLEMFEREKLYRKYKLIITDPNDSYKGDHKFITKITPTKDEYYKMLQKHPIVVMLDDIDTVLHPGTIEFMYYNCNVITLPNELVDNPLQVESIEHIPQMLDTLGYNNPTNTRDFVYSYSEKSEVYNKKNIECKLNS